jgi:hypothetical protein
LDVRWQIRTGLDRLELQHGFVWPLATIVSASALLRTPLSRMGVRG